MDETTKVVLDVAVSSPPKHESKISRQNSATLIAAGFIVSVAKLPVFTMIATACWAALRH